MKLVRYDTISAMQFFGQNLTHGPYYVKEGYRAITIKVDKVREYLFEFEQSDLKRMAAEHLSIEPWRIQLVKICGGKGTMIKHIKVTWTDRAPKWWERLFLRRK